MNCPHRSVSEIFIPHHEEFPEKFRFFACAVVNRDSHWGDLSVARAHLESLGHRDYYVDNLLSHIATLHNILKLWYKGVLNTSNFIQDINSITTYPIDKHQTAIFQQIIKAMNNRNKHYSCVDELGEMSDDDDPDLFSERDDTANEETTANAIPFASVDWKKFFLITGEAGTGKSQIVFRSIEWALDNNLKVLVAMPTALLPIRYENGFGEVITSESIHSTFSYPVGLHKKPTINWNLSAYDFIFVDEVSMISHRILEHVVQSISEIPIRPVEVMCGDCQQQQPIETVEGVTSSSQSALLDKSFYHLVNHYKLHVQYRVVDAHYNCFLQHIRYWQPTQRLLNSIQNGSILCEHDNRSDQDIMNAVKVHTDATVLTISRKAAEIVNRIVTVCIFNGQTPLDSVPCDDNQESTPIYRNMAVIITQHRDKLHGVLNGQEGTIFLIENKTVFIKLKNESLVAVYPVTYFHPQFGRKTCYPFVPSYALTMTKSQGQNLSKVLLWFDSPKFAPGCAYMALSRVKKVDDLYLLTAIKSSHVKPVTKENMVQS